MSKFSHLSSHVNPRILAGAVSVAVFLWLYVKLGETYQYRMTIPVQISRIHPDRALSAELPENITVRMQGLGSSLAGMRLLWGRNLAFALDLSQVTGEWACVPNDHKEWITYPPGFEDMLVSQIIGPDTIHVQVEPALE